LTQAQLAPPCVHPDFLQPHVEQFSFKLSAPMAQAIRARSLATGCSIGFIVRDCIRRGAPLLDQPLDVSGAGVQPAEQHDPA
jgi:hypothetical protein